MGDSVAEHQTIAAAVAGLADVTVNNVVKPAW